MTNVTTHRCTICGYWYDTPLHSCGGAGSPPPFSPIPVGSPSPFSPVPVGWKCPQCQQINAPAVLACPNCKPQTPWMVHPPWIAS